METTGGRLAHFEILGRLGAGGMGEVLLARDTRLEREVALKMLPRELARDAERLARFRHEALTLASLNHPNIATLHGIEETSDGTMVLVLERVVGHSLAERLEQGALPVEDALRVCVQVAEALEVAHARGVIHRDMKPANVMLGPRGIVKVLDFGLARRGQGLIGLSAGATREAASPALGMTQDGDITGTPGYMSPEQVLAGEQDQRTDIFAFGCVLYEALAGRPTFPGRDAFQVMAAVLNDPPDLALLPPATPARIVTLVTRCLEKETAQRLDAIREARLEIEETLGIRRAAALRTGEALEVPHNLPAIASSFVAREAELAACRAERAASPLVTLVGIGGCGKTRLALALAEESRSEPLDGVWFMDLAPVSEPARVVALAAEVLGVREEAGTPMIRTVVAHLRARRVVMVIDNCEHLIAAVAAFVAEVLRECPDVRILATSREPIGITGERVHAVSTLAVPDRAARTAKAIEASEAVQLFVARARAVQPAFAVTDAMAPTLADLCRQLDGIALAIELAAARVRVLSVEQIHARLGDRFRLLTGGGRDVLPRQQTLRATIEWSFDHLAEEEQRLLRRLAVFAGGWTLEQATPIAGEDADEFEVLDGITRLAEKSLVVVQRAELEVSRYLLLETVRQFSLERLEASGDGPAVRERHLAWFLDLAERSERHMTGPQQREWLARLSPEQDNLLAALSACGSAPDGSARGLKLAGSLWRFWSALGHYDVGRRALEESLARDTARTASPARAQVLVRLGAFALYQGDFAAARAPIEESLALYRALGDRKGVARALSGLSIVATYQEDLEEARRISEESHALYQELGEPRGVALSLHNLGYVSWHAADLDSAGRYFEQARDLLETIGDAGQLALTSGSLAAVYARTGRAVEARGAIERGLSLVRQLDARREGAYLFESVAELAMLLGNPTTAARMLGAAHGVREALGSLTSAVERAQRETLSAGVRHALGESAYDAAFGAGMALPFEQAMDEAFAGIQPAGD